MIFIAWVTISLPVLAGWSFIPYDSIDEFFPQVQFVAAAIRGGQAPWWNPFIYGGQPVLGDPQGMIFTPQTLVAVIAGSSFNLHLFDISTLAVQLFGGIALARYVRAYSDIRVLPILGAIVFLAGGVATSRLQHVPQIVSYGLLPVQLLLVRSVCLSPALFKVLLLAVVVAGALLNPNQVVFLSVFALLPFVFLHLSEAPHRGKAIGALCAAAFLASLSAAPVFSAIGEFVDLSNRAQLGIDQSLASSFPFFNLTSLFMPGLFGVHKGQSGTWSPTDITQDYLYIGLVPFAIMLSTLFCRQKRAVMVLCWGSVVFWFVFALGVHTPLYVVLFERIPGFSAFRRPADAAYFVNFFTAIIVGSACRPTGNRLASRWGALLVTVVALALAGAALVQLSIFAESRNHLRDLLVVSGSMIIRLIVIAVVAWAVMKFRARLGSARIAAILIALTIIDIASAGRFGVIFAPRVRGAFSAEVYTQRANKSVAGEALARTITFLKEAGVSGQNPRYRMEAIAGPLGVSMPMAVSILSTQGDSPIALASYYKMVGAQNLMSYPKVFTAAAPSYNSDVYRRLSLRYVLIERHRAEHHEELSPINMAIARIRGELGKSTWARRLNTPGMYEVWELAQPLPRAAVVGAGGTEEPCDVASYGTTSVSIVCHATKQGLLVLGDNYAPGWKACMNGKFAMTEPYQGMFRSVQVPAGLVRVRFQYQPVPFLRDNKCQP